MSDATRDPRPLVLLVDDDPDTRALYAEYLTLDAPYRTAEAADGKEALEVAIALQPEVIVMDMRLPVLSGVESMRAIREDARTRAIPIVALTGYSELRESKDSGFEVVLVKPCTAEALAEAIASLIRR